MSALCFAGAFLVFGLATFGVAPGELSEVRMIALGLALVALGLLLPGVVALAPRLDFRRGE